MASEYVKQRLAEVSAEAAEKARHREAMSVPRVEITACIESRVPVGYVYFIKVDDRVKIGFTRDIRARVSGLTTGMPVPPKLLASVPGTRDTEFYFHYMFREYRVRGEWFKLEGELLRFTEFMPAKFITPGRAGPVFMDDPAEVVRL